MKDSDYARTYSEMSDGQLAQLVSEGRDSLNEPARYALDRELERRGLTDSQLAQEYPTEKPRVPHSQSDAPHCPPQWPSIEDFRLKGLLRPWQIALIVLTLISTVTLTVMKQREAKLDELCRTVMTSVDSTTSRAALDQLATYKGRHALELLYWIASTRNVLDLGGNRIQAVRVLGERGDAEMAERLARLLRPYEGLDMREAVADSLLKLPCSSECIHSVLDYRERMWRGEPSLESLLGAIPKEADEHKLEIDRKLDRLLLDHKRDTQAVLVQTYGLGDITVSPFALHIIEQLKLTESCSLLRIDELMKAGPDEENLFPRVAKARGQIKQASRQLNCDGLPGAP